MEFEAWKAAGCPDMLGKFLLLLYNQLPLPSNSYNVAKDGDECLDWRGVGFPLWFEVKCKLLTTLIFHC